MGYSTDFNGSFDLDKPLTPEHLAYLKDFAGTRRYTRKADITAQLADPVREAVGLPVGIDGCYFVGSTENAGQNRGEDCLDSNSPPYGQPSLWCQWVPNEEGTAIEWDEGEKFYEYVAWLEYLIERFLKRWGYVLNGAVMWQGEDSSDQGTIWVKDNRVKAMENQIISPEPDWEED